jgi:hypothetical protein
MILHFCGENAHTEPFTRFTFSLLIPGVSTNGSGPWITAIKQYRLPVLAADTPKAYKMKKEQMLQFLQDKEVPEVKPNMSASELRMLVRDWIAKNVLIEVVRLAEEQGHKVVYTAPYHSDLQPMELVWALIKGNVGRQYNENTTLTLVYERLMAEFQRLEQSGHESVAGMIEKCAARIVNKKSS